MKGKLLTGDTPGRFIPPHGGYEKLLSYQKSVIVYDATVSFCGRFIDKKSRTHDQMVQAARSGNKNVSVVEPGKLELRVGTSSADIRLKKTINIIN